MKNLKIRFKMLLGFGSLLLLIIVLNAVSLVNLRTTSNKISELYNGPYIESMASVSLVKEMYQMSDSIKGMLLDNSSSNYSAAYTNARNAFSSEITTLQNSGNTSDATINELQGYLNTLDNSYQKITGYISSGKASQAIQEYSDNYMPAISKATSILEKTASSAYQAADSFETSAIASTNRNIIFQDILFILIVLAALGIALKMARDFTVPIRNIAKAMNHLYKGNFDIALNNDSLDELGVLSCQMEKTVENIKYYINDITTVLGQISNGNINISVDREYVGDFSEIKNSLQQIILSLNQIMSQVFTCCNQVRTGAGELAHNSQSLAKGAEEQRTIIDEFSVSLDKVASLTAQDGENAAKIKGISLEAMAAVDESNSQMQHMMTAMDEINSNSKEIAKVIKIIEDIAFQTNILALNAAVEAARAGTAGKGFAVVADEVSTLASRSADAANSTTQMITQAIHSVETGLSIANATGTSLSKVNTTVGSMHKLLEDIDKSTEEQGAAFSAMQTAIEQITTVVHSNSSAAEENSAASEELNMQAQVLDDLVSKFQLKKMDY